MNPLYQGAASPMQDAGWGLLWQVGMCTPLMHHVRDGDVSRCWWGASCKRRTANRSVNQTGCCCHM